MEPSRITNNNQDPESGVIGSMESTNSPSIAPETIVLSIEEPLGESTPQTPASSVDQPETAPESAPESHPRPPMPPSATQPGEEVEHAYWADIEEDRTTPDEEELKEIDAAEADYSACDCMFRRCLPKWQI